MAYINDQNLNELRSNVDIVEIISDYIPLTPKGKNFFGVCPFHQDHSPSMSVSKEKQMYKCFSCGAAGNVFTFVQNYENVSFGEAINIIASKVGYNLNIAIPKKVNDKYKKEYEMMDIALKYYENNLNTPKGEEAKKYLKERGLSEDDIKTFDIGLALNTNSLNKLLEKKGYTFKEMRDLGLISDKDTIKVVGFTGRVFNSDATPKYLGSK